MNLIDRIRWRLAQWLAPEISTARGKRLLEQVAREEGASKKMALGIATHFFRVLRDD